MKKMMMLVVGLLVVGSVLGQGVVGEKSVGSGVSGVSVGREDLGERGVSGGSVWGRGVGEEVGVPSGAVMEWFDSLMEIGGTEVHSAMVVRHGRVVGEMYVRPFSGEYGHTLFSCSKTVAALAVGIAVDEGRMGVEDRVVGYFPEIVGKRDSVGNFPKIGGKDEGEGEMGVRDSVGEWLGEMRVEDLLTMRSGMAVDWGMRERETEWVRRLLEGRMVARPGELFAYDSMNTYLLSAIVGRATGEKMMDYLRERLFGPLGIEEAVWEESPEGVTCGGWGLYLRTESLAKIGQLMLNGGVWDGRRIVSEGWIGEMMRVHVEREGYGYQMWRCEREGVMRGDGAHGQFMIVMPGEDMVVVITQCCNALEPGVRERRLLFERLVPALSDSAIEDRGMAEKLRLREREYALPMAEGRETGAGEMGMMGRRMRLGENKLGWREMRVWQEGGELMVGVETERGERATMRCGNGEWREAKVGTHFPPNSRGGVKGAFSNFEKPFTAWGSYGWRGEGRLGVKVVFADWMSSMEMEVDMGEGRPRVEVRLNIDTKPFMIETSYVDEE